MKFLIMILIIGFTFTTAYANEPTLLYPKSYYPQPEPRHYPSTGAICWKTLEGPWECQAGRPASEINVDTGTGGLIPGFGIPRDPFHKGKIIKGPRHLNRGKVIPKGPRHFHRR